MMNKLEPETGADRAAGAVGIRWDRMINPTQHKKFLLGIQGDLNRRVKSG